MRDVRHQPDDIEVKVSLAEVEPGTATMTIKQFAVTKPIDVPLHTYAEEGHLDRVIIHAGDQQGVLKVPGSIWSPALKSMARTFCRRA